MRDVFILARKVSNKPYTDLQTQTSLPFFKLLPSQNKSAEESIWAISVYSKILQPRQI